MNDKERVDNLEDKGLNWLEIAEILGFTYEKVRDLAENEGDEINEFLGDEE